MSIVNEKRVLVLNKNYQVINEITVAEAFSMMAADAATALDTSDGCFTPVKCKDWMKLVPRSNDDKIGTSRGPVRVPRIIVAVNYAHVVKKKPRLTMARLRERDGNRCAYTGKILKPSECSMEHVVPKSNGGKKEWTNIVLADRDVNSKRGNKPLEEAGLKLRIAPTIPKENSAADSIPVKFPEWKPFLEKAKKH